MNVNTKITEVQYLRALRRTRRLSTIMPPKSFIPNDLSAFRIINEIKVSANPNFWQATRREVDHIRQKWIKR